MNEKFDAAICQLDRAFQRTPSACARLDRPDQQFKPADYELRALLAEQIAITGRPEAAEKPGLSTDPKACFTMTSNTCKFLRNVPLRDHFVTKYKITLLLLCKMVFACTAGGVSAADDGEWRVFTEKPNGDVYFFDASRVETTADLHRVWMRIRYKTSVMAASSYQSLLEIDCSERTEQTLQRTFFSDKHWEKPAMKTDVKAKRKRPIAEGSEAARLSEILCEP